jgi:predicted PurR-regulated permease PerM
MSTQSRRSKRFLFAIGALLGVLSLLIILPFLSWILIAVVLAYVLLPIHRRFSRRLGPSLSAALSILVGFALVIFPIVLILGVAASQTSQLFAQFDPQDVSQIDDIVAERFGVQIDTTSVHDAFTGAVRTGARGLAGNLFSIIGGLSKLFIGLPSSVSSSFTFLETAIPPLDGSER